MKRRYAWSQAPPPQLQAEQRSSQHLANAFIHAGGVMKFIQSLIAAIVRQRGLLVVAAILTLALAQPAQALDLVGFSGIGGPMTSALTQIGALGPGIKALVGFVGFVVALISLAALRNFGPVLFYVGLSIFGAAGLAIAGAIMGATI